MDIFEHTIPFYQTYNKILIALVNDYFIFQPLNLYILHNLDTR
jgi:hypothetical protein